MFCLIKTAQNNKIINRTRIESDYEEYGRGKVVLTLENGNKVALGFGDKSEKVVDGYKSASKEECFSVTLFICYYARKNGIEAILR